MADRAANRAERNSSFARAGARRRPRAWAAPIARPAARIAVAGGLTLAGWLLGAALSQANAATDDHADRPAASAHDTDPEHRYAGTATSGTLTWAMPGAATSAKRAALHRFQVSADDYRPDVSFRPATVPGNDPGHHTSIAVTRPATKITKPAKAKVPGKAKHHAPASDPAPAATTQPGLVGSTGGEPGQSSPSSTNPESQPGLLSGTSNAPSQGSPNSNPEREPGLLSSVGNAPSQDSPNSTNPEPQPGLLSSISSAPSQDSSDATTPSSEPRQGLLGGLLGGSGRDSGPGLLGGLLGSPESGQPGLLDGILGTVDDTVGTTLHTTVTSVDTVIDTAPVRVVEPPVHPVEPAPVASGSVSASVPATKLAKEPEAPVVVKVGKQAPVAHAAAPARVLTAQPAAKQETLPASPVEERSQAGGGSSGGGEGLPAAPAAPAAPASTVSPGHDGHGGLRQLFALSGDGDTVTQLKLIGVSRDHEVDGAGRDAALPTTSPD
ncbi:hypothetical protein L3Q65_38485 [Amycolatopsis sp. FU40]|uniref:hypothetical protein n=1 Tax=Amycolatopsis sp. FU40 TaxID=2914159 RepID=UPI001F3D3A20|nr:hypothetical protein [Amycolatopsis sp. FU40]UKD53728.1 hypothetical protein L3Q65_38485 [Amycolatopsis sp. FU40]